MREIFRYQWRDRHYQGKPISDLWFALGVDDGEWWFDAFVIGRAPLTGGAALAATFARWLLEEPPAGRYEKEFLLIDDEPAPQLGQFVSGWIPSGESVPVPVRNHRLTVEFLLNREEAGGPESLTVIPTGHAPDQGMAFQFCEQLECNRLDRARLESAAAELLEPDSNRSL